jgi:glycosyltransferase involved in cell wall biosynthesis
MGRSYHRDLIFIAIARILSIKTIVFFRGWFDAYEQKIKQSKWKKFLFKISYAKASKYIVLGNIFKKKLLELGVPEKAEFFIETTVADSQYLKDFQLSKKFDAFKEEIRILLLARISIEKGIYIAIDAYKGLSEKYPEKKTSLIIAGEGPDLPALKKYVEELKIPGIKFMGHVDLDEKGKVLLESHVMILPSISGDGLPNSILEGMLYGMPIISRTTAGIPDVIQQDVNGYLSESLEPSVFTDFMSLIVNNSELYKKISENNHKTAIDKFTSEKVRERMIKIFQTYN